MKVNTDFSKGPAFTLIYCTYRPGGIDLLGLSLVNQLPLFELVVIDACPGRVERGTAKKFLQDCGVNVKYYGPPSLPGVPDKKGMARAYNCGAAHASTEHIIFIQDYCYMPPGYISAWMSALASGMGNMSLCGPAVMHRAQTPERIDESADISIWKCMNPMWMIHEQI